MNVPGTRARWAAAFVVLLACVACLPLTLAAGSRASGGGYLNDTDESSRAERLLERDFSAGASQFQLALRTDQQVAGPDVTAAGRRLVARVAASAGVVYARSWWTTRDARLLSPDGHVALVVVRLHGSDAQVERRAQELADRFGGRRPPFQVTATGRAAVNADLAARSRRELVRAESVSFPLLAVVLYLTLGSAVSAAIPLGVGMVCITGAQAVLYGLSHMMQVSVFAPNLATALGLGLAVDYSVIMISRFREERDGGLDPPAAAGAALRATARTVLCSAATVSVSLSALLAVPLPFLRSLGAAAVAVVVLACATALACVPVALAMTGHHLERGRLRPRRPDDRRHRLQRTALRAALRRPATTLVISTGLLLLLALPFLRAKWGFIDERWLPADAPVRTATQQVRTDFPLATGASPIVLLPAAPPGSADAVRFAADLSRTRNVAFVSGPSGVFIRGTRHADPAAGPKGPPTTSPGGRRLHGTWFAVVTGLDPSSAPAQHLVRDIRARATADRPVLVSGETAALLDTLHTLRAATLRSAAVVCAATGVLLALFTRSLFIPAKALVTNLLSLTAGFGAMVFLFQDGHLARWLGGTATGATDPLLPMLMFCIVFGVSMDYEIFIVARVREEHLAGAGDRQAVARGLRRTGPVVTACSLALVTAMAPLTVSSVTVMQLLGTVLVIGVLVDATVVRCLLVPCAMVLAGRWNWWLPFTVRRTLPRPFTEPAAQPASPGETGPQDPATP